MSKRTGEREILTIGQVADYLQVTERTIYRLSQGKKMPAFKVGGMWRYSQTDIDGWIKQKSMDGLDSGRDEDASATGQTKRRERK